MLVIGLVLAVVVGLTFAGIAVSQQLSSQGKEFAISDAEVAKAKNVIVLQAQDSEGKILGGSSLAATHDALAHRLDRAGISYTRVAFNGERIYVIFDDSVAPNSVTSAEDVLNDEYRLEVRGVMAVGTCDPPPEAEGDGAEGDGSEGDIIACDRVGDAGYALGPAEFDGATIADATAVEETQGISNGRWMVSVKFNAEGTRAFADLTARLVGQQWPLNGMALVLDGEVLSAPQVMAAITDGNVQISGGFDQDGAESLAEELRLASQGVTFTMESTTTRTFDTGA